MGVHKLGNGPITLTISAIDTEIEGNFGPQWMFTDGETSVYVNAEPAARQLGRLRLDADSAVGETLAFSQIKKDGKTFTNIERANAGEQANAAPRVASAPVAPRAGKLSVEDAGLLYRQCVHAAILTFASQLDEAGIPVDAQAVQSAAATIYISVTR